jgi:hypothetical protein
MLKHPLFSGLTGEGRGGPAHTIVLAIWVTADLMLVIYTCRSATSSSSRDHQKSRFGRIPSDCAIIRTQNIRFNF